MFLFDPTMEELDEWETLLMKHHSDEVNTEWYAWKKKVVERGFDERDKAAIEDFKRLRALWPMESKNA